MTIINNMILLYQYLIETLIFVFELIKFLYKQYINFINLRYKIKDKNKNT